MTASGGGSTNFIYEDILRANVGTSASIDGGSTFAVTDSANNAPRECMKRRFPIFLGSSSGQTSINTIEIDTLGNIGLGGISTDTSIVSSSGALFAGILEKTGYNFTWVNEITGIVPG